MQAWEKQSSSPGECLTTKVPVYIDQIKQLRASLSINSHMLRALLFSWSCKDRSLLSFCTWNWIETYRKNTKLPIASSAEYLKLLTIFDGDLHEYVLKEIYGRQRSSSAKQRFFQVALGFSRWPRWLEESFKEFIVSVTLDRSIPPDIKTYWLEEANRRKRSS